MRINELRHELQSGSQRLYSDWTREDLKAALIKTRQESGGLSLLEIADVIREALAPEEVAAIKKNL